MAINEERILIDAGLSEEQAALYSALLEKGPQKASNLASWTGIKRSLVYKILEQLENMGFVNKKGGSGTVAVFSPNHPSLLLSSFEQKEKQMALTKELITSSLGQLTSKYNSLSGKPNVQFFEGADGIKKVSFDSLTSLTPIYSYIDSEAVDKYFSDANDEYVKKRKNNKILKKIIFPDTTYARNDGLKIKDDLTEIGILKELPEFGTVMYIYDNKVSYIVLKEGVLVSMIIEDSIIYAMQKSLFEEHWKHVEKL